MPTIQPTVRRRRLGRKLRAARDATGLGAEDVAARFNWSQSKVSRIEVGRQKAKPPDVRRLLDLYEVTGDEREALVTLAREAQQEGWWHQYSRVLPEDFGSFIDLEHEAAFIGWVEQNSVPGLIQTEDYVRAQLRTGDEATDDDDVERRVDARMGRQTILRRDRPPKLQFVIDEGVTRRLVGGRTVMRAQLQRLLDVADMLNVSLQVMSFEAGAHHSPGSFVLFDFEDDDPSVVYASLLGSSVYVEKVRAIAMYRAAFIDERAASLSPAASVDRIAAVMKEL